MSEVSGLFFFFFLTPSISLSPIQQPLWIFPAVCSAPSSLSSKLQHIPSSSDRAFLQLCRDPDCSPMLLSSWREPWDCTRAGLIRAQHLPRPAVRSTHCPLPCTEDLGPTKVCSVILLTSTGITQVNIHTRS